MGEATSSAAIAGHDQALKLVSKQNYLHPIGCQVNFETLLYLKEANMSARAKRQSSCCKSRPLVQAEGYDGELSPAQWMASASSPVPTRSRGPRRHSRNFKRQPAAPPREPLRRLKQVGTWSESHCQDGRAKRKSATDEQGQKSACPRSVRSSGARRRFARRAGANCDASRPAPSAVDSSYEWCASADRCFQDCTHFGRETRGNPPSMGASAAECLLLGVCRLGLRT